MPGVLHYQLIEKLGAGAMGDIYKARDTRLNRFVAIKVLPPNLSRDRDRQRRFVQEAQAASALNHPNIVTIHNIVEEGDMLYIVMEYIAGKTLLEVIPDGGMRVPQLLRFAAQMADALAAAHASGIVHRDLKPANVMVTESGLLKVLDFGLAKWTGQSAPLGTPAAAAATVTVGYSNDETALMESPLTVEGSILGTLNYMAPEQAEGKRVDARADIFSFGAVLYEMATGRRAFNGDSAVATLTAVLRDEVIPIATLAPDVPRELDEIISRCLRKAPPERWQSIGEVEVALNHLRRKPDASIPQSPAIAPSADVQPGRVADENRPKQMIYAGAGAAVLAVALVSGWWWFQSHRASSKLDAPSSTAQVSVPPAPASLPPADSVLTNAPTPDAAAAPPPRVALPPQQPSLTTRSPVASNPATFAGAPAEPATASENRPAVQLVSLKLNDALPFRIVLTEDVPADAAESQTLTFRVADGVQVGATAVIAQGATVTGEVIGEGGKKRFLGIGGNGKMSFRLLFAESLENEKIRVRATSASKGDTPTIRPFDTGKGTRTKDVAAARGTEYIAYIDGDQTVSIHTSK